MLVETTKDYFSSYFEDTKDEEGKAGGRLEDGYADGSIDMGGSQGVSGGGAACMAQMACGQSVGGGQGQVLAVFTARPNGLAQGTLHGHLPTHPACQRVHIHTLDIRTAYGYPTSAAPEGDAEEMLILTNTAHSTPQRGRVVAERAVSADSLLVR